MEPATISHSISGACQAIGCGRTKIYQLINEGRLKAVKLGSKTLITHTSLTEMVDALPSADIGMTAKGGGT